MQKFIFILGLLTGTAFSASAQFSALTEAELTARILATDSLMFQAYNTCDTQAFGRYITPDLEFYHDKGGLMRTADSTLLAISRNLCSSSDWHIYREPVAGSFRVFPLDNYGAILIGEHLFYHITEGGKQKSLEGKARITHVFRRDGENLFRAVRILSYDHQPTCYNAFFRKPISMPSAQLQAFAGTYTIDGQDGSIIWADGGLRFKFDNIDSALLPAAAATLYLADRDIDLVFAHDTSGAVSGFEVVEKGKTVSRAIKKR